MHLTRRNEWAGKQAFLTGVMLAMPALTLAANHTGTATGAGGGGGGLPFMLIGGILVVIGVMGNAMFFGYAFMTGSLSLDSLLPGGGSQDGRQETSVQHRDALKKQVEQGGSGPSPPGGQQPSPMEADRSQEASGRDQSLAPPSRNEQEQATPAPPGSGGTSGNKQLSSGKERRSSGSKQPSPPAGQGGRERQQATDRDSGQQPDMENLKRDTARIQEALKQRDSVPQRDRILRELDSAMTAVDNDDLRMARSSLDRIKQMMDL